MPLFLHVASYTSVNAYTTVYEHEREDPMNETKKSTSCTIRFKSPEDQERLSKGLARLVEVRGAKSISEVAPLVADAVEGLTENAPESIMSDVQRHREYITAALACMSSVAASYKVAEDTVTKRLDATLADQAKKLAELEQALGEAEKAREELEKDLHEAEDARDKAVKRAEAAEEQARSAADTQTELSAIRETLDRVLEKREADEAEDGRKGEQDVDQTTIFDVKGVEADEG